MSVDSWPGKVAGARPDGLDLPPGYTALTLREHKDAFEHARQIAAEAGAGTLVWVRRFDLVEFAVVLEPEEPLAGARRALYAVMNALADAVLAYSPPERPVEFSWPDTLLLDGGILGGARLAWPDGTAEDQAPDWLVVGIMLRSMLANVRGPGHPLDEPFVRGTSLEIAGFEMLEAGQLIASFSRHLLVQFDLWREKGFVPVGQQFLSRLTEAKGVKRGLDGNGDLLVRSLGQVHAGTLDRSSLLGRLAVPQWLDPETGMPWL
jgi:biotin-(acetyl-CoA carboxylase) ligase